uniref:Uncharacterized protein n=1 Tax=Panagrolaimus sp. ES5 TaxID=591445 RepID=A0AC34GD23_9BILA
MQRFMMSGWKFTFLILCLGTLCYCGPVQIRIETDNQSNFHLGPGHRQTFELIEEYKPLSLAFNPKKQSKPVPKSVAAPPPPIPPRAPPSENVHFVNVDGKEIRIVDVPQSGLGRMPKDCTKDEKKQNVLASSTFQITPAEEKSHWLEWTRWSPCVNGERMRIRSCLEVNDIKCKGSNTDTQKCYSFMQSDIPFAKDPMVIEKEILGIDQNAPVA